MVNLLHNRFIALHREQLLERSIGEPVEGGNMTTDVTWKEATHSLIESLTEDEIQYYDYRKRFARKMLEEGSIGLIGYIDGEAAHVGWMSFDRIFSPPFDMSLGPGWAYFHRTRPAPKFRGLGLQAAGIRKRLEIAKDRGVVRAVNMVDTDNQVSLHNYRKMGFRDREKLWVLELAGKKFIDGTRQSLKTRLGAPAQY